MIVNIGPELMSCETVPSETRAVIELFNVCIAKVILMYLYDGITRRLLSLVPNSLCQHCTFVIPLMDVTAKPTSRLSFQCNDSHWLHGFASHSFLWLQNILCHTVMQHFPSVSICCCTVQSIQNLGNIKMFCFMLTNINHKLTELSSLSCLFSKIGLDFICSSLSYLKSNYSRS